MSAVQRFRSAQAERAAALAALLPLAAAYVDSHLDETDLTGEWERMRGIFGQEHWRSWDSAEVQEDAVTFYKTTQRGLAEHWVVVPLDAIA